MKNFKIRKKLLVSFMAVLVMMLIVVISAIASINTINSNMSFFYEKSFQVTSTALDMRRALQSSAKNACYAIIEKDSDKVKEYLQSSIDDLQQIKESLPTLRETYTGDQAIINTLETSITDAESKFDVLEQFCLNNQVDEATDAYFNQYYPSLVPVYDNLNTMYETAKNNAHNTYVSSNTYGNSALIFVLSACVIAFLIAAVVITYVTRSLIKPIHEIETAILEMAKGRFNLNLTYQSKDELGNLSNSLRSVTDTIQEILKDANRLLGEMANGNFEILTSIEEKYVGEFEGLKNAMRLLNRRLNATLVDINQSADQVAGGSDQVAGGAQALSQGATEQASSIQELTATISEIAEQISETSKNADLARDAVQKSGTVIDGSSKQMSEMMDAMNVISEKSNKIGNIIKTIEDIAFQTNILALNAAVEAARAGEAGKGFSVVADEVRNLAAKSGVAAKDTTELIEETIGAVKNGIDVAERAASSMDEVATSSLSTVELVKKIADAADRQSLSVNQVKDGIEQISNVVQTNSATAQESAATSQQLSGQAQILKNLVGKFNLRKQ